MRAYGPDRVSAMCRPRLGVIEVNIDGRTDYLTADAALHLASRLFEAAQISRGDHAAQVAPHVSGGSPPRDGLSGGAAFLPRPVAQGNNDGGVGVAR